MRKVLLSAIMVMGAAHAAAAQEAPNSQTLDEQLARVQQGQPAVPMTTTSTTTATTTPATTPAATPASPASMPNIAPSAGATVSTTTTEVTTPAEPQKQMVETPMQAPAPVVAEPPQKQVVETPMEKTAPVAEPVHKQMAETPPQSTSPAAEPPPVRRGKNGEVINATGAGAIPALPLSVMTQNDIKYMTGGVGDEEEAQLKSEANNFNLQLLITASTGEYLSRAMVRVLGEGGKEMLSVNDAGPYFYASLPPGSYTMEVTARRGGIKTETVTVPATGVAKRQVRFNGE